MVGFAVVAGLLTMVPGLDTALVMRYGVAGGVRAAYAAVAGICLGLLVWGVAAAVGLSALLAASQVAYDLVRLAGAGYMVFLGAQLIWRARRTPDAVQVEQPTGQGLRTPFLRGLLTNVLNPKIGVFYMAVLPQFLPADSSPLIGGVVLALVHVVLSVLWFSLLILGMSFLRPWLAGRSARAWIDRVTGGVLIGFGLKLAFDRP